MTGSYKERIISPAPTLRVTRYNQRRVPLNYQVRLLAQPTGDYPRIGPTQCTPWYTPTIKPGPIFPERDESEPQIDSSGNIFSMRVSGTKRYTAEGQDGTRISDGEGITPKRELPIHWENADFPHMGSQAHNRIPILYHAGSLVRCHTSPGQVSRINQFDHLRSPSRAHSTFSMPSNNSSGAPSCWGATSAGTPNKKRATFRPSLKSYSTSLYVHTHTFPPQEVAIERRRGPQGMETCHVHGPSTYLHAFMGSKREKGPVRKSPPRPRSQSTMGTRRSENDRTHDLDGEETSDKASLAREGRSLHGPDSGIPSGNHLPNDEVMLGVGNSCTDSLCSMGGLSTAWGVCVPEGSSVQGSVRFRAGRRRASPGSRLSEINRRDGGQGTLLEDRRGRASHSLLLPFTTNRSVSRESTAAFSYLSG